MSGYDVAPEKRRGGGGRGAPKLDLLDVLAIRASRWPTSKVAKVYNITLAYAQRVINGETHCGRAPPGVA